MSLSPERGRRCPVCGERVGARADNPAFPFCRPRCHQIDLGRWLGGDYVISRPLSPDVDPGAEPFSALAAAPGDDDA